MDRPRTVHSIKQSSQKSVKTDNVNFIDSLAKEAEDAAARGNMKQLYDTTRKLAGKLKQAERPIKHKNGVILTSEEDQMGRRRDHFEELLNRPAPSNPPDIPLASEVLDLEVNCERPDREEIRKAISLLKTGKAPGPDEIPAEAVKADMETSIEMLYDLIGKIWDTDEIPIGWKEGYLSVLPRPFSKGGTPCRVLMTPCLFQEAEMTPCLFLVTPNDALLQFLFCPERHSPR